MLQLKIWDNAFLDRFIDDSQKFNNEQKKIIKAQEIWEIDESNLAYFSLQNREKKNKIFDLLSEIGFQNKYSKTLIDISTKRKLLDETLIALSSYSLYYKEILEEHKSMMNDPFAFYRKNKKIDNLENSVLTFGTLSLSYSFCSPIKLISEIIQDSLNVKEYHNYMLEVNDSEHKLEDFDSFLFNKSDCIIEQKIQSLVQDLRGNKIPEGLLQELLDQIKFDKRETQNLYLGDVVLSKKTLTDAFYVFFGSKLGSEFIIRWKEGENKENLKQEFEKHIYENPYVNLGLVDMDIKKFGTKEHVESAKAFLEYKRKYPGRNVELDLGLFEE